MASTLFTQTTHLFTMRFKTRIIPRGGKLLLRLPSTVDRKLALKQLKGECTVSLWDMKPLLKLIRLKRFKKIRKRLLRKQTKLLKMRAFFLQRAAPLDKALARLYSQHISSNEDALNRAHLDFHSPLSYTEPFAGMTSICFSSNFFQSKLK